MMKCQISLYYQKYEINRYKYEKDVFINLLIVNTTRCSSIPYNIPYNTSNGHLILSLITIYVDHFFSILIDEKTVSFYAIESDFVGRL